MFDWQNFSSLTTKCFSFSWYWEFWIIYISHCFRSFQMLFNIIIIIIICFPPSLPPSLSFHLLLLHFYDSISSIVNVDWCDISTWMSTFFCWLLFGWLVDKLNSGSNISTFCGTLISTSHTQVQVTEPLESHTHFTHGRNWQLTMLISINSIQFNSFLIFIERQTFQHLLHAGGNS